MDNGSAAGKHLNDVSLIDGTENDTTCDTNEIAMPRKLPSGDNLSFGVSLGTERDGGAPVFQFNEDRFRHTIILGRTGSGKSNLVHQMEREDIRNGAGCFILAAHEDDALYPLSCVPEERLDDVVLLDFSNPEYLPRMNPLDVDANDHSVVDKAVENALELLTIDNYFEWTGPRFEKMARDGLRLLMDSYVESDRALSNLARVYVEPEYVKDLLKYCRDHHVYDQWVKVFPQETKSSDSGEVVHWFVSKVSRFASDRTLRHVFGAGHSTVDMRDIVDNGRVLIAYVPESRIGTKAARTISKWLVMQLREAIMRRIPASHGYRGLNYGRYEGVRESGNELDPFIVYVDEFAKFASTDFETLLAEARKQRVALVLSTQTLSQTRTLDIQTGMAGKLEEAILGNVGSMICYPMGGPDVQTLAHHFDVSRKELRGVERYQPMARLCADNDVAAPITLRIPLRHDPDNPTIARRIAQQQVETGTWIEVDDPQR